MKQSAETKKDTARIRRMIENVLASMNADFDSIEFIEGASGAGDAFMIRMQKPDLLIGEGGETLSALTHLIRRMAYKGLEEAHDFSIDINDHRSGMILALRSKARTLAEKVRSARSNMEMEPMSSYERLIVHGALAGEPNVKTESVGDGAERRIVIKYTG